MHREMTSSPSTPPERPSLRRSSRRSAGNGKPLDLPPKVALVLGGGGLKGFAHIGALRAFEERGVHPSVVAGTSIGAMIAAAYVGGMPLAEMERRALALTKKDLFRIDHFSMVAKRMLAPALYLERPLQEIVDEIVPRGTFRELQLPLLVNTVDLEDAAQVLWGLPGLQDVSVADAVYASCALPGFFPPRVLGGRTCADGGVIDNVPVVPAAHGMDAVIAVDVGSTNIARARRIKEKGFAAIYMRAAQVMMKALQHQQLAGWQGPPLLLVRPAVWRFNWFSFANVERMIELGYEAAVESLDRMGGALLSGGGVWPRRLVEVRVDREKCIGCTLCASLAPRTMAMDQDGKAIVLASPVEWSRADGDFVHQCPTAAIAVEVTEASGRRSTLELPVLDE
jgi:NTE family protein